jgi:hypothetical protein
MKYFSQDNQSHGRVLNLQSKAYEAGVWEIGCEVRWKSISVIIVNNIVPCL